MVDSSAREEDVCGGLGVVENIIEQVKCHSNAGVYDTNGLKHYD